MNYKVLIVDDSPLLRATVKRAVLQAGVSNANIREAGNGQQALAVLAAEPVDIVLLDINMPVMDGFEFVERTKGEASYRDVRIALVTTEGNQKRLQRMTDLGVTHYLRKPFEPEDLRQLVVEMFGKEA